MGKVGRCSPKLPPTLRTKPGIMPCKNLSKHRYTHTQTASPEIQGGRVPARVHHKRGQKLLLTASSCGNGFTVGLCGSKAERGQAGWFSWGSKLCRRGYVCQLSASQTGFMEHGFHEYSTRHTIVSLWDSWDRRPYLYYDVCWCSLFIDVITFHLVQWCVMV